MTGARVFTATHTYKSEWKLAKCACGKRTTGRVKNVKTGETKPLCSTCAYAKGFR